MISAERLTRVFVELADTLVDEFDALDLLHTLAERSVELLRADAAGVIVTDQRDRLQVVASTSDQAQLLELFELQSAGGPCLESFTTGRAVANVALDEAQDRWPRFTAASVTSGYRSTSAFPLRLRSRVIGAINLYSVEHTVLDDDELAVAHALADVATIGLLQERSVRQSELVAEQLQTALNSRVLIEQAKGVLLGRAGVTTEQAFALMRGHSRRTSTPLREVAAAVIDGSLEPQALARS